MNVSLYQAAAAMNATSKWEDIVSENLSSSSIPGFRKQAIVTAAIQGGLVNNSPGQMEHFSVPESSVVTSFQPGETTYTGDNSNVALDGSGFFQVKLPTGDIAVTRDGEFHKNAKGLLVSKEGYVVMGTNGPIQLDPASHEAISITRTGQVQQGGVIKGKLGLTDFENPQLLTPTNGVYFLATDPALKPTDTTAGLRDGFVEGANTTALGEMANMMTAMRTFEANQHVIQIQDDRLGKTITELGNPTS
jgi:flagellar basal body rod protein FlgG